MKPRFWNYYISAHLSLFLLLSSIAGAQSTGTIVKFTISGINHTNFTGKSFRKGGYEDEVEGITFDHLKEKYKLNLVDNDQEPKIKTRFFNSPFGSIKSQTRNQKLIVFDKGAAMSFKIRCKVNSREGLLGILLPNVSSNNAFLLVKIGVFENGKLKEKLKARKNIVSGFSISSSDEEDAEINLIEEEFISIYSNALKQLEVY
jgi:hypothetical protein